jgi:hypothetical protein
VLQETLDRSGVRPGDLVAVASAGGVARIPIITTTLSEHFRVPVVTTARPELTAAIGAGLIAVRGTVPDGMTVMAAAAPAAAAVATEMAPVSQPGEAASSTFRALAWSDADDIPDVAPTDPYDYAGPAGAGGVRPQMQFDHEPYQEQAAALPWYRSPGVVVGAGAVVLLAALAAAVAFVMRADSTPTPASTTTVTTTPPTTAAAPTSAEPAPPQTQAPPQTRTVTRHAPPPVTQTQTPPPPATTEPPPPPPTTTEPPPPTTTEAPSTTTQPPWSPTAPYPTIPGLPWVPAPHPAQPVP